MPNGTYERIKILIPSLQQTNIHCRYICLDKLKPIYIVDVLFWINWIVIKTFLSRLCETSLNEPFEQIMSNRYTCTKGLHKFHKCLTTRHKWGHISTMYLCVKLYSVAMFHGLEILKSYIQWWWVQKHTRDIASTSCRITWMFNMKDTWWICNGCAEWTSRTSCDRFSPLSIPRNEADQRYSS